MKQRASEITRLKGWDISVRLITPRIEIERTRPTTYLVCVATSPLKIVGSFSTHEKAVDYCNLVDPDERSHYIETYEIDKLEIGKGKVTPMQWTSEQPVTHRGWRGHVWFCLSSDDRGRDRKEFTVTTDIDGLDDVPHVPLDDANTYLTRVRARAEWQKEIDSIDEFLRRWSGWFKSTGLNIEARMTAAREHAELVHPDYVTEIMDRLEKLV